MSHSGTHFSGDAEEYWRCGTVSEQRADELDAAIEVARSRREFDHIERHEFPSIEALGVLRDVLKEVLAETREQAVRRNFGESGKGYAQQERQTVARVDPAFHPGLSGPDPSVAHVVQSSVAVVLADDAQLAALRYVVEQVGLSPMCIEHEDDRKWRVHARPVAPESDPA